MYLKKKISSENEPKTTTCIKNALGVILPNVQSFLKSMIDKNYT